MHRNSELLTEPIVKLLRKALQFDNLYKTYVNYKEYNKYNSFVSST